MGKFAIALVTGLICGFGTALSAYLGLLSQGWTGADGLAAALVPYLVGGFVAGLCAAIASHIIFREASFTRRFALALTLHAILAVGISAAIFALQYRIYFAQWHAPVFTFTWMLQTFFTTMGSLYLFLSTGLVLLVPWAVMVWIIVSAYLARIPAPSKQPTPLLSPST